MTEMLIEEISRIMKKKYSNTKVYRMLQRHDVFKHDGYEFTSWKELSVYKAGQWITETIPSIKVEVELDGNDSSLKIEADDEDLRKLSSNLFVLLRKSGVA